MINKIEKFKTNDGEEFLDEQDAENHIINQICEEIDKKILINCKLEECLSMLSDKRQFILNLVGTIDKAKNLKAILNFYLRP